MKLKKFFTLLLIGAIFASCSNDDTVTEPQVPVNGKTHSLTVNLMHGVKASLRVSNEEDPQNGLSAEVQELNIFIHDEAGNIAVADLGISDLNNLGPLLLSKEYKGIREGATKVYVVANVGVTASGVSPFKGLTTIAQVKAVEHGIGPQNTVINAQNVVMDGSANAQTDGSPSNGIQLYKATVTISPAVSRIEIASIVRSTEKGNDVNSFQIDGVYFSHFYSTSALAGISESAYLFKSYSEDGSTTDDQMLALRPTAFFYKSVDADAITAGKVIAFNFYPSKMPHVLIRLKNVTYNSGRGSGVAWITIKKYQKDGTSYANSERGLIYKIDKVEFSHTDIGDRPGLKNNSVGVDVKVAPWTSVNLTPEL